ncbi:glycosyltransferase family 39 protein [Pedococcus sp. NPDC057267]|uniref:glycosyltransferase family 39 protein n=1 Tax=Pedococcus sp. NPDC057267 TaxID=3346077 RepID=UPI00362D4EF6
MTAVGESQHAPARLEGRWSRHPVWWPAVLGAALAQVVVLTLGSTGYGYHRDELYFRMLPRAWGYVDQPPLTPLLAHLTTHLADATWALRIPATLAAAASVVLIVLITRELGGGRGAQALAAWGYAFAAIPLMLGHLLLTSTVDLPLLALLVLAVLRVTRGDPRWWLAAGAVAGLTTYNRLLVSVVVAALGVGILALGPRRSMRTRWLLGGAVVGLVLSLPNLLYQATHGWPQLAMGRALADNNAADVRSSLPLLLLVMLGPPLVVVWVAGLVWLLRRPQRAKAGYLAVACLLLIAFTWVSGAQPQYPAHLLSVAYAAGCVPVARWLGRRRWAAVTAGVLVAVNAAVSVVLALPVVPVRSVGSTPVADISPLVADQVGWPRYVAQVAAAYRTAPGGPTQVVTSNYGEAGAIARYGRSLGLPRPLSGQNALADVARPPDGTRTVLVVGYQLDRVRAFFASCRVLDRLDNGVGVDSEEQGAPVAVCTGPRRPWATLWQRFHHLD